MEGNIVLIAASLIFGIVLGGLVNYFSLGFCGAVTCPVKKINTYALRSFLISALLGGIGIFIFKQLSGGVYDFIGVMGIDVAFIIGAFIFGIGMILSDGCVLGMMRDLGRGYLYHIFTFVFLVIGTLLGNLHYREFWLDFKMNSIYIYLPDTFGALIGVLLFVFITLSMYAGLYLWDQSIKEADDNKDNDISPKLPKKYILAGVLIGLYLLIYEIVFKNNLGISGAFPYFGAWFVKILGIDPTNWSFFQVESAKEIINKGILSYDIALLTVGIFVGSLITEIFKKSFEIKKIKSVKQVVLASMGGLLMGYGACIAGSCNLGGFLSSAANLSLSAWIYMIFMFFGSLVTIKLFKV